MSILCLAITSWKFLKQFIKILNIISLVLITLIIITNIQIFVKIKKTKFDIIKKYQKRMCLSFVLILLYIILIVFNIYNSIYLSIKLHIADFPEYGGRKRDQNYIDKHPDKFGNVPLKQFVIAGFCPSIISVLNLVCTILSVAFRKKMIMTYNKMRTEEDNQANEVNEIILNRNKPKHRHTNRNRSSRKNSSEVRNTKKSSIKNNNTEQNIEQKDKKVDDDNNLIKIKINNLDKKNKDEIRESNNNRLNNNLDTKDTLNNKLKKSEVFEPKLNTFDSV